MIMYALDTNIITYILKGDQEVFDRYCKEAEQGNEFVFPPIVYFEIRRWFLALGSKNKALAFEEMCQAIPLGDLNRQIWDVAANLYVQARKTGRPVDDSDLIIAAFCLVNEYVLVTHNTRHFENIDGLIIVDWKS